MKTESLILNLYPNSKGLCFAFLEPPQQVIESGIITARPLTGDLLYERLAKFLAFHRPTLILLRGDKAPAESSKAKRIAKLVESAKLYAAKEGIPVYEYSREQIQYAFEQFGARSKYQIARQIVEWIPEMAERAPKVRKPWEDEEYSMGIFDALSLAVAHQYLTK